MVFEMVAGRRPFPATDPAALLTAHLDETPPHLTSVAPACPHALDALVGELLAKDPARRPVDAHAVVRCLESLRRPSDMPRAPRRVLGRAETSQTLDRWESRLRVFEELAMRGFDRVPGDVSEQLAILSAGLGELRAKRASGLGLQRRLEVLEADAADARERLGRAVHSLGSDLSIARHHERRASLAQERAAGETANARREWRNLDARLAGLREGRDVPGGAERSAARVALAALDRWCVQADAEQEVAARAAETRAAVEDLAFQVQELAEQLQRVEATFDARTQAFRAQLEQNGIARKEIERALVEVAGNLERRLADPRVQPLLREQL